MRVAEPTLDLLHHLCHVDYRIIDIANGTLAMQASERHTMRFFFPMELEASCELAQLELRDLFAFPSCDRAPTADDWNALLAACARP